MGRDAMGKPSGADRPRDPSGLGAGWSPSNPGPSGQYERFLDSGKRTRYKRKIADPCAGTRFGELTVLGPSVRGKTSSAMVPVQCSCGASAHSVSIYSLLKGSSTRCHPCAKAKTAAYRKMYYSYSSAMPDGEHRRRLLNRLSSAVSRCHNIKNKGFENYGMRGITVAQEWRDNKKAFLTHVQTLSGWDIPSLEMDRIDCDKGYEPGNVRFITRKENMLNKRKMGDKEHYIRELESRLRSCKCGA